MVRTHANMHVPQKCYKLFKCQFLQHESMPHACFFEHSHELFSFFCLDLNFCTFEIQRPYPDMSLIKIYPATNESRVLAYKAGRLLSSRKRTLVPTDQGLKLYEYLFPEERELQWPVEFRELVTKFMTSPVSTCK